MAASVEPGTGCDTVWPGSRVAGNLGRRRVDTDRVNAKHDCRVNKLALHDVVAWHRDTHGGPCHCVAGRTDRARQAHRRLCDPHGDAGIPTTRRAAAAYAASERRYPRRTWP
jgi:hypothetical protein